MSESNGGLPAAPAIPAAPALEITAGAIPSPALAPAPAPAPEAPPTPEVIPSAPAADPATPAAPDPAAPAPTEPAKPAAEGDKPPTPEQEPSELSTQKPADPKPGETKPGETPVPDAPVGYEFTMPEGIDIPKAELEPYVETLREHGITPQAGQKLLDMYVDKVQQLQADTLANQWKQFGETRKSELARVKSDPELGGAGYETSKQAAARGRDLLLGTNPEHVAEFERFVANTGAGEQLALWRIFIAADRLFRAPVPPVTPATPPTNARGQGPQRGVMSLMKSRNR